MPMALQSLLILSEVWISIRRNELKIKRDGGIQTDADGTSVIDRVEKAGDTMTGDLFLSNNTSGPDIVRHLGCLDISEGKIFSITMSSIDNQFKFENDNSNQFPNLLTVETTDGFAVNVVSTRELEVGGGFIKIFSYLNMVGHKVSSVADPTVNQDVATKRYVDARKRLITVWASEKGFYY